MNSYQTANAAHFLAGKGTGAGVRHGRGYHFRRAMEAVPPADHPAVRPCAYSGKRADVLIPDDVHPSRWNDEDKARQLSLRAGGVATAAAGGTSWPRYAVRQNDGFFEVFKPRDADWPPVRFKQHRWADLTANAYIAGMSPRRYAEAWGIDIAEYTLA